jgi:hemoglobin/transferrin/lactoferrin receptor protein
VRFLSSASRQVSSGQARHVENWNWRGFAVSVLKNVVVTLMAGTAFVLVMPHQSAWAQSDESDQIVLDDADNNDDSADQGGVTKLKRLVVGSDQAAGDIANTPAPVSTIDTETFQERFAGNTNDAIRSTPGAFTRETAEQPGIVVNVRGMQGMGRVNTMIDGVPQTFRNLSGHGGTFDNMAYVDPNMLVGVDIARGAVAGNEGLGTLSGAANFRTIGIDDVLLEGKNYGVMQTLQTGTNGFNFSRLTAAGWRHDLSHEGSISMVGALSGSNQSNYRNGDGIEYPYDAAQNPSSGLFKLNFAPNSDHSLELGGIVYKNAFAVETAGYDWAVKNQTYTTKYAYQPGDNLIDLKINAYMNITDIKMTNISPDGVFGGRDGTDTGLGLDISNTSIVDINAETELKLFYGAGVNSDDYKGNDARGANPDGTLIKSGAFADAMLTRGIFSVTGGLRYDAWKTSGVTKYPDSGERPELSRDGGEWNPKLGATVTPVEWMQVYANYAHTMRPPTASEMFYPGGHNFTGTGDPINNNPNLLPERQKGLDIGVNFTSDDLLTSGDQGYLKVGYFHNKISDYITYGYDSDQKAKWINLPGTTTMQGVELEGGYDTGFAYGKLAVTIADTKQPLGIAPGFGSDVGQLPDDFVTFDAGTRFFEQKVTVGGRIRYTGESFQAFGDKEHSIERPSYTLYDAYASWKVTQNFSAFVNVENVFNKSYWTANSGTSDIFSGITNGRGRTIIVGATARF